MKKDGNKPGMRTVFLDLKIFVIKEYNMEMLLR